MGTIFETNGVTFKEIRKIAANHMRTHVDVYAPFLALSGPCKEFDEYCDNVESEPEAVWGGQTEINAIAASLHVPIWVYEAGCPVLKMGCEYEGESMTPLRISYHRHYYALGEHYNSVTPLE